MTFPYVLNNAGICAVDQFNNQDLGRKENGVEKVPKVKKIHGGKY